MDKAHRHTALDMPQYSVLNSVACWPANAAAVLFCSSSRRDLHIAFNMSIYVCIKAASVRPFKPLQRKQQPYLCVSSLCQQIAAAQLHTFSSQDCACCITQAQRRSSAMPVSLQCNTPVLRTECTGVGCHSRLSSTLESGRPQQPTTTCYCVNANITTLSTAILDAFPAVRAVSHTHAERP
jgi:hypothetical protein